MLSPLKGRGLWPVPVLPGGPVHNARRKAMRLTYARCNRPAHSPLSSGISKGNAVSVKVETLILLGATGDLAHRMLFPSLYNLPRSEEHTSELQSLMRNSYAVFCMKKKIIS